MRKMKVKGLISHGGAVTASPKGKPRGDNEVFFSGARNEHTKAFFSGVRNKHTKAFFSESAKNALQT